MLEQVKQRLQALGVPIVSAPTSTDEYLVDFAVKKTVDHIKNQTNLNDVPEGLTHTATDMAVGECLFTKKSMGQLQVDSLNFEEITKRIKDGDTDVEFAIDAKSTPEAKFEAFLNYLQHNEFDFVRYRVMLW